MPQFLTAILSIISPLQTAPFVMHGLYHCLGLAVVPGDETIFRHNSSLRGPRTYRVFLR